MNRIRHIAAQIVAAAFIILLAASCSKKKSFIIAGELEDVGSQLINASYYAAGGMKRVSAVAAEGKFAIRGESTRPTLLTLTLSDGTVLAYAVVENGDKITVKGSAADPLAITVAGNGDSEKIARWVNENASLLQSGNAAAINASLAKWVGKNRSSKAATALMATYFQTPGYEHTADSLMTLLSSSARAQEIVQNFTGVLAAQLGEAASMTVGPMSLYDVSDTVVSINPRTRRALLLCFMATDHAARDSVLPHLFSLNRAYKRPEFESVEISSAADSASWRQSLTGDSATWRRTWAPATVASSSVRRLGIPRYPYFILTDSAGTQIYRGSSISAAEAAIKSKLNR